MITRRELLALASIKCLKAADNADYRLLIDHIALEIAPKTTIRTTGYNGTAPGPLLRMKEGQRVTIQVDNNTAEPEIVHWHGLHIPSEVDGSVEEGTPMIAPHASAQYSFTASPSGTRWYHTHVMAMRNLKRGAYSGQFGFIYIEPKTGNIYSLNNDTERHMTVWDRTQKGNVPPLWKLHRRQRGAFRVFAPRQLHAGRPRLDEMIQ